MKIHLIIIIALFVTACGTLDSKTININPGDSKENVLNVMGPPQDRQFEGSNEAWQYCVSGAGFGYNDHKIIWFVSNKVAGITSYRSTRSGCVGAMKSIDWEQAPDFVIEHRNR